eukprot:g33302.t1
MARPVKKKDAEDFSSAILTKLTEELVQKTATEEFANDVTILFCGSKKSGKTSLVDRFINPTKDEKDQPKPTVALDYKFARYATEGTSKVLAHIYDLGGDEANENLIGIPISTSTVGNIVLAITLDLSERLGWDWGWAQKGSIKYLQWMDKRWTLKGDSMVVCILQKGS